MPSYQLHSILGQSRNISAEKARRSWDIPETIGFDLQETIIIFDLSVPDAI
jgi:hypothetical protein